MGYMPKYHVFVFEDYSFNIETNEATFTYSFDEKRFFTERVLFQKVDQPYDADALERALSLSFWLVGTSYFKLFPTPDVMFKKALPDQWQANFLTEVYTQGLSQFMFENELTRAIMPRFEALQTDVPTPVTYQPKGVLALQSGGKDSLLLSQLLHQAAIRYTPWYLSASESHPAVLDELDAPVQTVLRRIDLAAINKAVQEGGINGHVPVTYIVASYAVIDAILQNKNTILLAIGAEGNEPHEYIGDIPVNHQWSKTWQAERLLADYIKKYIASTIQVGSPLRGFSELRIAELFVEKCWNSYGHAFSSCNVANYKQGKDNQQLTWCGECPKCANSYLLFAPFVQPKELQSLFGGTDLFKKPSLAETFKGLLGIDGVMKPFECVGEVEELRLAYQMSRTRFGEDVYQLPFGVPKSNFDYRAVQPSQEWSQEYLTAVY